MYNYFPNVGFAWAFLTVLVLILSLAAYIDWRSMTIPKWLTIPLFGLGILVSIVRGAWLGFDEAPLYFLPGSGLLLGGLDGLLFALVGSVVGFGMLFLMWILGTCGGGDVKLFAALGTWLGPVVPIFILAGSLVVLFVQVIFKLVSMGFSGKNFLKMAKANRPTGEQEPPKPGKLRITYSFPVAVATLVVLLWFFRVDLRLAAPKPAPNESTQAHVR